MGTFGIHTTGLAVIEKKLLRLERKVASKIVKKSLREGAKFMKQAEKASVTSLVGGQMGALIARNIIVRALKKRRGSQGVRTLINPKENRFVGYSRGSSFSINTRKQASGKRYYIPSAIEYGHAYPGRGGGGSPPKDVPARPAFRSAFDANAFPARRIVEARILLGVEDEVRKL